MTPDHRAAWSLAEDWIAAWNAGDLDGVMAHYAPLVGFCSPRVVDRWDMGEGWIHGWDALRMHFAEGLDAPGLRYELEDVLIGAGAVTIVYRRETGARVAETLELDDKGRARRVVVAYGQPSGGAPRDA